MKFDAEEELLSRLGLGYQILDSACCGMAGGFGFEKVHYDVSVKAGEQVLFPEVRKADADTLIIADGFSCREQIAQATGRRALHVAEAIRMALPPGLRLAIPGQVPLRPRVGQALPLCAVYSPESRTRRDCCSH